MKLRSLLALALVLLLLSMGLVLVLKEKDTSGHPLADKPETADPEPAREYLMPAPRLRPAVPPTPEPAGIPLPRATAHTIPGEYTLFFADEAGMQAFITRASSSSLTLLGQIPQLLAVRVRGSAGDLQPLLGEGMTVDNNYSVRAPTPPDSELWEDGSLRGFNAGALGFLDAPADSERLDWGIGVTIAVLDTGWNAHPGVSGDRVRLLELVPAGDGGSFEGHGTAVTGLIASTDPFAPGIAPGSDILSIRVLDSDGQGDAFTLAQGIFAAVDNGADVINMSIGGYGDSQVLREAVNFALSEGVSVVAASGNDGIERVTYPAAYPGVIGVTAVDANGNRAPFANYGSGIDLSAPGYEVHALWESEQYILFNGTSASAPLVSGMVARILQGDYAQSPEAVQALLRDLANDTGLPGDDLQYGAGILNALRIEESRLSGIHDVALADLYPATEESDGTSFPLYVTFENRGTEFVAGTTAEIAVNGSTSYYRFPGLLPGQVESVQVPVFIPVLEAGGSLNVSAKAEMSSRYEDARPANNAGEIILRTADAPEASR